MKVVAAVQRVSCPAEKTLPQLVLAMRAALARAHGMPLFNVDDQGGYLCMNLLRIKAKNVKKIQKIHPRLAFLRVDVALKIRPGLPGKGGCCEYSPGA
jgi:hypothetical protein